MLVKIQKNWAPLTLLVGVSNGPTTLENNLGVSCKTQHATAI